MMTEDSPVSSRTLLDGIFGPRRVLYKQWVSFSCFENESVYRQIAQQPYSWLVRCGNHLADLLAKEVGFAVDPTELLIDAPPVGLEVQFSVQVAGAVAGQYCSLGEISPVVNTLATRQFDDFVKQVRVFVSGRLQSALCDLDGQQWLLRAADLCGSS